MIQFMDKLVINPVSHIKGEIHLPGDKSISHRAVMLGSIAEGKTIAINFLEGEDCLATINCFKKMGVNIELKKDKKYGSHLYVKGAGLNGLKDPKSVLDVGNSGTTMRIMLGILAGQAFEIKINGDMSIQRRPMARVSEPLKQMGAKILGRQNGNFAPLTISGGNLKPIEYKLPIASAQVKSAILLAGLYAKGTTAVIEEVVSRDHTERMLGLYKASVKRNNGRIEIEGGLKLIAPEIFYIPGDISSAAYFMVAAALVEDSELLVKEVGVNPTRNGIVEVMRRMGVDIKVLDEELMFEEPKANLLVKASKGKLKAVEISGELIPRLIDEIPVIAVLATQAEGETVIKDAAELRVKESDRIATLSAELRNMGADIKETDDGMAIKGPVQLKGAHVKSHGDHRIAMALAVAAMIAEGQSVVDDAACIQTSFPQFENILKSISA